MKFTKPLSASCGTRELRAELIVDLELPVDPDFRSFPPLIPLEDYCRRNRELRQWFPGGIPTDEARWQAKSMVPFELL